MYWNINKKKQLTNNFSKETKAIFSDENDANGINHVIRNAGTIYICITTPKDVNESIMLSFAVLTPIYSRNTLKCLILDYLGTAQDKPSLYFKSEWKYEMFLGKGMAKLLINISQLVAYARSSPKDWSTQIVLKASSELQPFYESVGSVPCVKT